MKNCTNCQIEKDESDFSIRNRATGRLQSWCKACMSQRAKLNFQKPEKKAYNNQKREEYRDRNYKYAWDHLSKNPCPCGESDPRVLEFDHIDPSTKRDSVSELCNSGYALQVVIDEIAKCRVLCCNCHRRHTYEQQGFRTF